MADYTVYTGAITHTLPSDPVARADIEHVLEHGYVILKDVFTREYAEECKAEIARLLGGKEVKGRNAFEGLDTTRIYALLNKTRTFDRLALLPRVRALNTYFLDPGYNISSMHTISILPGETPQELHCDDGFCNLPRPRPPLGTAIIVALDDFTAENGATRVVPGSHKLGSGQMPRWEESEGMVCEAGSVVYFIGTTWHGGGPNRSDKPRQSATVQYCQPYIRQIENQILAVDPRRLGEMPRELVDMLGYRTHKPFIGYVDGLNPYRGAMRFLKWAQKPLNRSPPTFPHDDVDSKL